MNDRLRTVLLLSTLVAAPLIRAQSTPPKAVPSKASAKPNGITVGSDSANYSLDPKGDAARLQRRERAQRAAWLAFERGDLRQARRLSRSILLVESQDVFAACLLADVDFSEGRAAEAGATLAPMARPGSDPRLLMRAALAAGLQRRSRLGGEAYCRNCLARSLPSSMLEGSLPKEGAPGSLSLVSALALGAEASSHGETPQTKLYYGLALRLDPGNPLANFELSGVDAGTGHYAEARARLGPASRRGGEAMRGMAQRAMHNLDRAEAKAKADGLPGAKTP